jgi:hypothetical protein
MITSSNSITNAEKVNAYQIVASSYVCRHRCQHKRVFTHVFMSAHGPKAYPNVDPTTCKYYLP